MKLKLLTATSILACAVSGALASPVPDFTCDVPAGTILDRDGYRLGDVLHVYDETLALETYGDLADQLPLTDSHGAIDYYAKGDIRVAVFPDGAQIELAGGQIIPCVKFTDGTIVNEVADLPEKGILGASLGSTVRSAPNLGDNKIDKLPEGEPIFLLGNTGQIFDGYDWFKIEYSEGLTGFVWGGTLCSKDVLIRGTYQQC